MERFLNKRCDKLNCVFCLEEDFVKFEDEDEDYWLKNDYPRRLRSEFIVFMNCYDWSHEDYWWDVIRKEGPKLELVKNLITAQIQHIEESCEYFLENLEYYLNKRCNKNWCCLAEEGAPDPDIDKNNRFWESKEYLEQLSSEIRLVMGEVLQSFDPYDACEKVLKRKPQLVLMSKLTAAIEQHFFCNDDPPNSNSK